MHVRAFLVVLALATTLAAGGVILDVGNDALSVRPRELRYGLVRDAFFRGATSLPIAPLLQQVLNPGDAALTWRHFLEGDVRL